MVTQTETRDEALKKLFGDRRLTIETLMEIEDKGRRLVPFKLNKIQANMIETSSGRDVYVKPGQVGATSVCVADFLLDNLLINGTVSVIVSYDDFSASRQIVKAKKYYNALKRRIPTIPRLDHKSATEMSFDSKATAKTPAFYSVMYIFSARSYTIGRGEAIHNLLLDEYAFWPEDTPESIWASAVQRVPLLPGTKIRVLSTANGENNAFYELYRASVEGKNVGASVYRPHFYPWYDHEEYTMLPSSDFALPGDTEQELDLDEHESILMDRLISLGYTSDESFDKLRWRRYKIAEMQSLKRRGETQYIFEQEYPEDDSSCFVTAGDMVYDPDIIKDKVQRCYPSTKIKPITAVPVISRKPVDATLEIWEDVQPGYGYVIGVDPGKSKNSESVIQVWRFADGFRDKDNHDFPPEFKHCATLAGYYDEDETGALAKVVGYYYNTAVLAPEDNLDLVSHVKDYPELYYRQDPRNDKVGMVIGWQTNVSTKPYMVTEIRKYMEFIDCADQRFWDQCRNVRRDPDSKSGLKIVGAEDHHMAGGIAIVCRSAVPVARGYVGSAGWGDDWGR